MFTNPFCTIFAPYNTEGMKVRLAQFLFITFFIPSFLTAAYAQQADTFIHTISQGETVYSIARTYQVTPAEIIKLNPSAAEGIRTGAQLIIPQKSPIRYHTIQAGETLYYLTNAYNVTADAICKANPGLTADNFKAGMVILIPSSGTNAQAGTVSTGEVGQKGVANSQCREMYKVKRKETIYSIARQFKITKDELVAANPEMKEPGYKLKKGSFICIPFSKKTATTTRTVSTPSDKELINKNKKAATPQRSVSIGVILPFKGETQENKKMIEFYRGMLMAVSDMKDAGLSVDIFAYDSGKSGNDMQAVLDAHPLSGLDLIIGPLYQEQAATLGDFCKKNQVRLVIPFTSHSEGFYQNPYCFAVNPPKSYFYARAAELTTQTMGDAQFIVLDSDDNDEDAQLFVNALTSRCSQKVRAVKMDDGEMTWLASMNQYKNNVIIPNGTSVKLLNRLFPRLKQFVERNPEYTIKIVGYPEWQTYVNNHLDNFYQFDTYVISSFYRNPFAGSNAEKFEHAYQSNFRTGIIASWPCFGMLGYDIAYYFMKGISSFGDAMDAHLQQISTSPYQHSFDFERINNWGGFINLKVQFIHYTSERNIYLID